MTLALGAPAMLVGRAYLYVQAAADETAGGTASTSSPKRCA
jgi:hypothetical protein